MMSADDAVNEAKARIEALVAPVNGGVGEDASYDAAFEAIKTEIDKVNSIDGGSTDWSVIRSQSEAILLEKSKDFRVALYYGAAQAQNKTIPGVLEGLVLLLELCNTFWEPMWPALKRPRARGLLCGWYSDVVGPAVHAIQPTAADRTLAQATNRSFRELDGLLAERLGEAYPGMLGLRESIAQLERRVPADAPPPPPPPPPPQPRAAPPPPQPRAAPASSGGSSEGQEHSSTDPPPADPNYDYSGGGGGMGLSPADVVDPDSAYRALGECAPLIGRAADVFIGGAPTSADGFRLQRVSAWLLIGGAPYSEGGSTQLDGPYEHVTSALTELAASQDWQNLLATATQVAADFPLYLDATRAITVALEGLGSDYDAARVAVTRETAALLARAPELPTLSYANGVAFANDDTKAWLTALASGGGGGGGGGGTAGDRAIQKAMAEAEKLVGQERGPDAIGVLSRAANQANGLGHRFKARLELAKLALKLHLVDVAQAQLGSLERVAEEHKLAAWDPDLAADLFANLYRAQKIALAAGTDDGTLAKESGRTFQRVCELDAALALKLMSEGQG